jgi:hypothetical protein
MTELGFEVVSPHTGAAVIQVEFDLPTPILGQFAI